MIPRWVWLGTSETLRQMLHLYNYEKNNRFIPPVGVLSMADCPNYCIGNAFIIVNDVRHQ